MLSTARTRCGTRQPCAAGTGNGRALRVGSLAQEATMLKWTGRTALVAAVAMMTLGCVRGLAAPTAAVEPQGEPLKPVSANAGITPREVTVLWHDIGIYRASGPLRLAGPMYEATSYETNADCEDEQQTALTKEALSRV